MEDFEKKEKLVSLLDQAAFDPVLKKNPDNFSTEKRQLFDDVKRSTESEKNRFHNEYRSPKEVKDNFLSDLSSQAAKKKHEDLRKLGLPKLPDVKKKFLKLCDDLKV